MVGAMGYILSLRCLSTTLAIPSVIWFLKTSISTFCAPFSNEIQNDVQNPGATLELTSQCPESEISMDKVKESSSSDSSLMDQLVPYSVRAMITIFFFLYVGIEVGFGGWVPTYALSTGIATNESNAAYLTGLFFGGLALGRIVSVPISLYLSTTTMIRIELLISFVGSVLFANSNNYVAACWSSAIFGFGLGSIFPMMLIVANDYSLKV